MAGSAGTDTSIIVYAEISAEVPRRLLRRDEGRPDDLLHGATTGNDAAASSRRGDAASARYAPCGGGLPLANRLFTGREAPH